MPAAACAVWLGSFSPCRTSERARWPPYAPFCSDYVVEALVPHLRPPAEGGHLTPWLGAAAWRDASAITNAQSIQEDFACLLRPALARLSAASGDPCNSPSAILVEVNEVCPPYFSFADNLADFEGSLIERCNVMDALQTCVNAKSRFSSRNHSTIPRWTSNTL